MFLQGYGGFKAYINHCIRTLAVHPWLYPKWTKLFPHVFVHKHGTYWYFDEYQNDWERDTWPTKYGGWSPFIYCSYWWHEKPTP